MRFRDVKLVVITACLMIYSGSSLAANLSPRTCSATAHSLHQSVLPSGGAGGTGNDPALPTGGLGGTGNITPPGGIGGNGIEAAAETGGIGGTGNTVPPGGIGGNGIEAALDAGGIGGTGSSTPIVPPGGVGGTGNTPVIPPGGIGGTGITMAGIINKANGDVILLVDSSHRKALAEGDEICTGDKIIVGNNSQARIKLTDGALLHILKNTEVSIDEYAYASASPELSRSIILLNKGDIRSVSGAISKINPSQYAIKTPIATIRVVGTDFLVTHLPDNNNGTLTGTYVKVLSGAVNVTSAFSSILLRAGEAARVLLNGVQSIIESAGGTCAVP